MSKRVKRHTRYSVVILVSVLLLIPSVLFSSETQSRIDADVRTGKPVVIHVSVALADNRYQGIVPVPSTLGNGQEPRSNLYWGARYGLMTYFLRDGGWKLLLRTKPADKRILQRIILRKVYYRRGRRVSVYLVADAWNGRYINEALRQFLRYSAGYDARDISFGSSKIRTGGAAHLLVYIGHNVLMDTGQPADRMPARPVRLTNAPARDAIVLACRSKPYFLRYLVSVDSSPLLLTTGLMAPEAYSLHAAIEVWVTGRAILKVRKAAARAYAKYQRIRPAAAAGLFDAR